MRAALVILDGWGIGDHDHLDAVREAETPNFDRYREAGASGTLETHGRSVGLPSGQMGNSEVGHLNIGAGRVVKQETTRISDAIAGSSSDPACNQNSSSSDDIEDGSFFENEALVSAFEYAEERGGRVHFMGLVSDGGVHSAQSHLHALIDMAAERGTDAVTHAFTDGRDTAPESGARFLRELENHATQAGTGDVATVTGRYYAMDRDENWGRTKRAYDAIVEREAEHVVADPVSAAEDSYERGDTDEYVEPTLVEDRPALQEGDGVVFFNFRSDRARQLTRMLADVRPEWGFETDPPETRFVTMTQYDRTFGLPVAFPPHQPADTLGEVVADAGLTQLRLAESEKYAHVTYFLNGGREVEFEGEHREIVPSPDVPTYDEAPAMSAAALTDEAIEIVAAEDPDVLVLNYANPDMVGHTGDFEAAVEAVEAVDEQLGRLVPALERAGAHVVITADHGNADDMGTRENPHTAHTLNPVPFVYLSPAGDGGGRQVSASGTLADVAPTVLALCDIEKPGAMTGESILE